METLLGKGSNAAITTLKATRSQVEDAARKVYENYPEILKALGFLRPRVSPALHRRCVRWVCE